MATTPRSGSNLLCQLLFERAQIQEPKEFLNIEFLRSCGAVDHESRFLVPSLDALLDCSNYDRRETAFPICIKAMYSQFAPSRTLPGVSQGLGANTVILLLRQDIVAQAVSLYIAESTGQWTSYASPRTDGAGPPYDFAAIDARVRRIEQHISLWRQTFDAGRIDHREVFYEHLMADPVEVIDSVMQLWQLKLRPRPAHHSHPHARQTTALNADFIERYRLDVRPEREKGGTTA